MRRAARFSKTLILLKGKSENEIREHLTKLMNTDPILEEYIVELFLRKNWMQDLDKVSNQIPRVQSLIKNKKERKRIISELEEYSISERKRKSIELLTNWESVDEYEQAVLNLIEIGNEAIPDILELLNNEKNIPITSPPPWKRDHTIYNIILKALKSIPDKRALNKLVELSLQKEEYVSKLAQDALKWIKSGVPYPFKYERILLTAEDVIPPYEKRK